MPNAVCFDSHAHLADPTFADDVDAVIARARDAGVVGITCIGESIAAASRARVLAARHAGYVHFTCGVHPHDAHAFDPDADLAAIRAAVEQGAVAIGECGLDYHYDHSPRASQLATFEAQLAVARDVGRPVVVHTREAEADTMALVASAGRDGIGGILHCYTGSHALARVGLDAGWYVSFSGIVTFKKWVDDELVRLVPDDRLLVESDAPYLAPVPMRGKRNEPAFVPHTVVRLASARGTSADDLGARVVANARRCFGLVNDEAPL